MARHTLEQKIQQAGGPLQMLRTSQTGPYVFPIAPEFSNWRDETEAWSKTCVLLDQSLHMTDLYIEGKDTIRLLAACGINNFSNFGRGRAKQFVACNQDGFLIGDAILFGLEDHRVNLVGRPPVANWVEYNAGIGGYDVALTRDARSLANKNTRLTYRFEIQGPNAWALLETLNGGKIDGIKFFSLGEITIAGRRVRALKHGMAAAPGLELFGPVADAEDIRAAILEAGAAFGLKQAGARAYSTASTESGWLASVLPAIYSGDAMRAYREWLPGDSFEAVSSLGGSYLGNGIEDYYLTPYDAGYDFVHFGHDFIGRDALLTKRDAPHLRKATLTWDIDDVVRVFRSQFNEGDTRFKFMEAPASYYATFPFDAVYAGGKRVGLSTYAVYSSNARRWISLALVEAGVADGASVSVLWGEPDGGSARPVVERHAQTEIKATVGPSPLPAPLRAGYRN